MSILRHHACSRSSHFRAALTSGRRDNETPLHKAALYGSLPVVKTLIEAKADVNAKAK